MLVSTLKTLSIVIRDRRKSLNMSQEDVARLVGVKQSTVSAIETRPGKSHINTLLKILSALDLELHFMEKDTAFNVTRSDKGDEW